MIPQILPSKLPGRVPEILPDNTTPASTVVATVKLRNAASYETLASIDLAMVFLCTVGTNTPVATGAYNSATQLWEFRDIADGTYRLYIPASTYFQAYTSDVFVVNSSTITHSMVNITPASYSAISYTIQNQAGLAITPVLVQLRRMSDSSIYTSSFTLSSGRAQAAVGVGYGHYTLVVSADMCATYSATVLVSHSFGQTEVGAIRLEEVP